MTIRKLHYTPYKNINSLLKAFLVGREIWLRPAVSTLSEMKYLCSKVNKEDVDYLEFMVHSSELMAGGSPYFSTKESVEEEYSRIEDLFEYITLLGYEGVTLAEYRAIRNNCILEVNTFNR